MSEYIIRLESLSRAEEESFGMAHERITRCRDCDYYGDSVCKFYGAAGWFFTDPEGYCFRAIRRKKAK